jgi:hypothetical protein
MDLEIFDIKLSSFIKAFRKSYDVGNGTYDYMSFLKDTDCASYCAMQQSYKNPNAVLNFLITPSLNTIDVVGGKKRKMKGGAQEQYIFIIILFLLAVSNVFAGPKYDELVRQFGSDISAWPKQPGTEPSKPQDRWFLFVFNIGPSAQAQTEYNTALSQWNDDKSKWEKFEPMQKAYEIEYGEEQNIKKSETETKLTEAKTKLTEARTDLEITEIAKAQSAAAYEFANKLLEETKKNAAISEAAAFWKGISIGGGAIIGLLFLYVTIFSNRRVPYGRSYDRRDYYVEEPGEGQGLINNAVGAITYLPRAASNAASNTARRIANYPENDYMIGNRGGKTKTYRKKRVTRRRH